MTALLSSTTTPLHHYEGLNFYIDPPYNTGAKDWKYNNNYVEGDDDYRHSKWLAFMERRLEVAKELLNPDDSVLIVTIDEKEYLRLGMLLEQTFPEATIQMATIVINPNGVARGGELARVEEYAYFCFFGSAGPDAQTDTMLDQGMPAKAGVRWEWLMRGGSNSRRVDRPNLFYPIYINEAEKCIAEVGDAIPLSRDPASVPPKEGLLTLWPIRTSGEEANWRTSPEYLRELLGQGYAKLGAHDRSSGRWSILYLGKAQLRRIESGELVVTGTNPDGSKVVEPGETVTTRTPKTVWNRSRHAAGEHGSRLLRTMLPGRVFPFPKALYAVEDCLRVACTSKPDAIILDFFSGSGTTAHAVMRLNKQDGGRRQCISVTNNEVSADEQRGLRKRGLRPGDEDWESQGICDYITKPRVTAAITGRTPQGEPIKGDYKFVDEFPMSEGFEANAAFFTLTYEAPLSVRHNRAFERIAPMLWMRAGSQGRIITDLGEDGWDVAETYGVLENLDQAGDFVVRVAEEESVKTAFIVTDDDSAFQMVCRDLPSAVLPVRLYESYLQNFMLRGGR
ncbi:site-specific DNA-methyltransferase [Bowdeniella nasicola]|uniref:Site-specific DNA-methyltransferase n=1 Tax=Bowdeniella nasicola TaxID=208480 RepID=A0A1Q5Q051_9ACTO|nr:DNA methyltransferase [Bowdeniella nasicola]OKL53000.1 site-specific DNA-methyltransferase [Bowdeniella nasicola]